MVFRQPSYSPSLPSHRTFSTSSTNPIYSPSLVYSDSSTEESEVRCPCPSCDPGAARNRDCAARSLSRRRRVTDQASIQDIMAIGNDTAHVSDVMAGALSHLDRVVEHLRGEGENEAANSIAQNVHSMLDTFNETTATWAIEKFQMKSTPAERSQQLTNSRGTLPPSQASTWAAVAATDIPGNNRLVKFGPSDGLKRRITDESVQAQAEAQAQQEDFRCVWIYGWTKGRPLSAVTEHISSGAIFSTAYVPQYEAVCVIFQYAIAAVQFLEEEAQSLRNLGVSLFGHGHEVRYGAPYPENADLKRMAMPFNERRRLTFARQQLFTNGLTEERFKKELYELVGEHNVELVWLFNTGNATVVFSSTVIARIVRDEFNRRARKPSPYREVQIGFSHDPCERPLNLITQIHGPGTTPRDRSDSARSGTNIRPYNPTAPKFVPGVGGRGRKGTDSDGWQTVHRKR